MQQIDVAASHEDKSEKDELYNQDLLVDLLPVLGNCSSSDLKLGVYSVTVRTKMSKMKNTTCIK